VTCVRFLSLRRPAATVKLNGILPVVKPASLRDPDYLEMDRGHGRMKPVVSCPVKK